MFHRIADPPPENSAVSVAVFQRCLSLIAARRVPVLPIVELASLPRDPGPVMSITFDDGRESDHRVAFEALSYLGLRATFFVVTGQTGRPGYMTWPEVRELAEAGMEIGSHTHTHPYLTAVSAGSAREELERSRGELEERLGRKVTSLSLPHGYGGERILGLARQLGYEAVCVSRPGLNPLPLPEGASIRRNALHRLVTEAGAVAFVTPMRADLLARRAGYLLRELAHRGLGTDRYMRLRDRAARLWRP